MNVRWLRDARIDARMHAQGLPLDMMLSVDRGSDAVVLRVTTRHLTREEARELGSRLIEAALLAGEREIPEPEPAPHNEHGWARGADESNLSGGEADMHGWARTSLDAWVADRGVSKVQRWIVQALVDSDGLTQRDARRMVESKVTRLTNGLWLRSWQKVTDEFGGWSDVVFPLSGARWNAERASD